MDKRFFLLFNIFLSLFGAFSASFAGGKELFNQNNIEDALLFFEEALIIEPSEDVYMYLAESYMILGYYEDAVLVLEEAVAVPVKNLSYFYFKLGNAYYSSLEYQSAIESYTEVVRLGDKYVNEAYLNSANVAVESKLYSLAIDNYTNYLTAEPNSSQKRKIVKMIGILKKAQRDQKIADEKSAEEAAKSEEKAKEEAVAKAEAEKEATEAKAASDAKAEAERVETEAIEQAEAAAKAELSAEEKLQRQREEEIRQEALMNDILNSLDTIGENAQGINATSEEAFGELEGSDIDE